MANEVNPMTDLTSTYQNFLKYKDNDPKIELDENFTEYKLGKPMLEGEEFLSHEAGFDALMTGYVFFKSLGILSKENFVRLLMLFRFMFKQTKSKF